ncbi:PatA/PatG family cyanobactin maturation protease [Streptomyces sp. NBRC 110611]|uniref:PatA/PatG family cyanobactin maturation protease n=1 Tax=Streptomyces sp. NBRC 110611 TaxID=1621259 RepID=UPI00082C2ED2|nr:PatA/PatG family cyanobactin maturation protease [Streptomyces sp. NBRC 110611]
MVDLPGIPGLAALWGRTTGHDDIRIAVVDGEVDLEHPAFSGAAVTRLDGPWAHMGVDGAKARHGTSVASVIFGQHHPAPPRSGQEGPVLGMAPRCRGLIVPVFSEGRKTSQVDLARGIEAAVEAGAHVINLSGGQLAESGEADGLLRRAVELCAERNVLLVAAAGNDGCLCSHVPAALPSVLAVGAVDDHGVPLESSNFGSEYDSHGLLAPGAGVLVATPGGGTARAGGTSLATPIVSGLAALLLSLQRQRGKVPDPLGVGALLLASADPCDAGDEQTCQRYLNGKLNVRNAVSKQAESQDVMAEAPASVEPSASAATPSEPEPTAASATSSPCTCRSADVPAPAPPPGEGATAPREPARAAATTPGAAVTAPGMAVTAPRAPVTAPRSGGVTQSGRATQPGYVTHPGEVTQSHEQSKIGWSPLVYALGTLGYDFGGEARRDTFKQLMDPVTIDGTTVPANPYDSRQMVDHLTANPSEARSLIWTLNLELTPVYALEPAGAYGGEVYALLSKFLGGEVAAEDDPDYIERISVPGRLTDRTVRLFSGQVVPVVEVEQVRGLYGWRVNALLDAATQAASLAAGKGAGKAQQAEVQRSLREFLTRVYYDLRNLGSTSRDRALNFAATNAFQAADTFSQAVAAGMALDTIDVQQSPFGRQDSDCWDVKLRFFDPENSRRARKVFRFTIDVSDLMPVTLGDMRTWSEAG